MAKPLEETFPDTSEQILNPFNLLSLLNINTIKHNQLQNYKNNIIFFL